MLTAQQKGSIRKHITDYTVRAEASRLKWHYTQQRPFHGWMDPPEHHHSNDCSGYVSLAYNWAMHKSGVYLADPLNYHYSGWGYTGSLYEYLKHTPAPVGKYLVGDIALWGPSASDTHHTAICRKAGSKATALFSSNGHESWRFGSDAPNAYTINSSSQHLIGVYRHPAMK